MGKIHELHVKRGDTVTLGLPGGGGYGDPMERHVADVLADIRGGLVTREGAARDCGVVIADGAVDMVATNAARARTRVPSATFGFGPDRERWEAPFTDAVMTELNARLYTLPKAVRQEVRREVFEAVVPGITGSAGRAVTELLTDPSAATRRLRVALNAMGQGSFSGGGAAAPPPDRPLPPTPPTRGGGGLHLMRCRIGIDVGGTFTDFVLADRTTGGLVRYKEPSVPSDPSLSVERGLPLLIEHAGVAPSDVELVVHGTTLAFNAIIQRRGARLGLVVSRGNRGMLEIGRAQLPSAFNFLLEKEPPLVPRSLVLELSARLDHRGNIVARCRTRRDRRDFRRG